MDIFFRLFLLYKYIRYNENEYIGWQYIVCQWYVERVSWWFSNVEFEQNQLSQWSQNQIHLSNHCENQFRDSMPRVSDFDDVQFNLHK